MALLDIGHQKLLVLGVVQDRKKCEKKLGNIKNREKSHKRSF